MFTESARAIEMDVGMVPARHSSDVAGYYRLEAVAQFIASNGYRRVALQFPDSLLSDSPKVVTEVSRLLEGMSAPEGAAATPAVTMFILADNTFGACCPDEITAAHYTADCIIHFGYACMSKGTRLPVMYVHQREEYDPGMLGEAFVKGLIQEGQEGLVVVVLDKSAAHLRSLFEERVAALAASLPIVMAGPTASSSAPQWVIAGERFEKRVAGTEGSAQHIVFVGSEESPVLSQLSLVIRHNDSKGFEGGSLSILPAKGGVLDGPTAFRRSQAVNQALRAVDQRLHKRMYNVEALKTAQAVGILVCTLSIQRYRESAELLKRTLRRAGKRCYVIYIGHLNEFKVANFADSIDCFCVIACPHSRVAQFPAKGDNMMKPLCSPVEVLISLGYADFDDPEAFTTDFAACCQAAENMAGPSITMGDEAGSGALVKTVGGGAVAHFESRTYKGLDARVGETAVQREIVEGRSGIARGYATERESQK